jgi:hypothetical protein
MKTHPGLLRFLVVAVGGLAAGSGSAAAGTSQWELEAALGAGRLGADTSYEHRLTPAFEGQPEASGTAAQDLELDGAEDITWRVGARRMLGPRVGIEALYGGIGLPLSGVSTPLRVDLEYVSTQPPDHIPTPATFSGSTDVSDPEGDIDVAFLCINLVTRAREGGRVQLDFSGGVSLFSFETHVAGLGYQTFWLGGHGVLFTEIYELTAESERKSSVGANLGLELAVAVSDRWKIFGEARAFLSSTVKVLPEPSAVINADQVIRDLALSDIKPLTPLEVEPSFVSLSIGLRILL